MPNKPTEAGTSKSLSLRACVVLGVFSANQNRFLTINEVYDKIEELTGIGFFKGMSLSSCFDAVRELHDKNYLVKKSGQEYWMSVGAMNILRIKE